MKVLIHRRRALSGRESEAGIVILLVAIVLLFVVGAMAALAIDIVSTYTARSEAQLAADSAALAGARVMANSGMTSRAGDVALVADGENMARAAAIQVAVSNKVGGRNLVPSEVNVTFVGSSSIGIGLGSDPRVTVKVTRSDLPTFFARIWGTTQTGVSASATAEAYNPSGHNAIAGQSPPVAPLCVKPWVLPNISPKDGSAIFDTATGAINDPTLIGWTDGNPYPTFFSRCTGSDNSCVNWSALTPIAWRYYPGDQSSFPQPTQGLQSCAVGFQPYKLSIAGCVTVPIACNSSINLDQSNYVLRNTQTGDAVNCLTHSQNNQGDTVAISPPTKAFQFEGGNENPITGAVSKNVLISDSLVTVPVYQHSSSAPPANVPIIGFVQLFLNPDGIAAGFGTPIPPHLRTTIVNLVGCGTNASGQPVFGNGSSPVAVRLITSP